MFAPGGGGGDGDGDLGACGYVDEAAGGEAGGDETAAFAGVLGGFAVVGLEVDEGFDGGVGFAGWTGGIGVGGWSGYGWGSCAGGGDGVGGAGFAVALAVGAA